MRSHPFLKIWARVGFRVAPPGVYRGLTTQKNTTHMRHPIAWPGQHRTTWPDFPRIFPIRNGLFCELSATFFGLVTFEKTSPSLTEASYPEPSDFTARRCLAASRAHRPHRRPAQHVRGRSGYDLSICTQRTSRKERLLFDLSYIQNMSKSLKAQILSMLILFLEWDEAPEVTRAEKDDKARVNGETLPVLFVFLTAVSESSRQNIHENSGFII